MQIKRYVMKPPIMFSDVTSGLDLSMSSLRSMLVMPTFHAGMDMQWIVLGTRSINMDWVSTLFTDIAMKSDVSGVPCMRPLSYPNKVELADIQMGPTVNEEAMVDISVGMRSDPDTIKLAFASKYEGIDMGRRVVQIRYADIPIPQAEWRT